MRIGFVVARVGDQRNVIQRLALALAAEMRKDYADVDVVPFSRKSCFNPLFYRKINRKDYDCVLIANVGLQCAFCSALKRLGLVRKPFIAFSFGSDIRATGNRIINIFNQISKPAVDLLIVVNPDLVNVATSRGYRNVVYVPCWSECLS